MKIVHCALLGAALSFAAPAHAAVEAPAAPKKPHETTIHGDTLTDEYFWLREKSNPEVIRHLETENAYADEVLAPLKPLREQLYAEMLGRIKQTDLSVPYRMNGYAYYSRTVEGSQYPILCRKKIDAQGGFEQSAEQVMLDVNQLAQGKKFMQVDVSLPSPDNRLLAYTTDETGYRQFKLHIKNLETGEVLPFTAERVTSVAWADDKTLFYVTEDATTKRSDRLHRHELDTGKTALVFEEKDELFRLEVRRDRSGQYLFAGSASYTTSEVRFLPTAGARGAWQVFAPRVKGRLYDLDYHGGYFYITTDDTGRNFRIARAKVAQPDPRHWEEVVAHRRDVTIEGVAMFKRHLVRMERQNGLPQLHITDLQTGAGHRLEFPEPVYNVRLATNFEWDSGTLRYSYQSLTTPSSVYDYDIAARKSTLLKRQEVLGNFDPEHYRAERLHATAPDGTRIPVSLVYRRGTRLDGSAPLLLYGYGSYGISTNVSFSSSRLSLLDRGAIFAIAHIRGGGDLGKTWHDDGKLLKKKNTFTDFIAAAEFLVNKKYTSQDRLVAMGGSAGGLLVGAVANMRPDLFKAIVSHVPFVDVMNTMLDASLPLTVGEYEEWGNPNDKTYYDYMKSYSPYDNLKRTAYPAMLVRTGLNDSQVMYWEPAKYVARLRSMKTDGNPLLFVVNMGAGHGGSSGRYDQLKETALDYAFVLKEMGLVK
ncbi:MAG TPA: S9 family peptidase [Paucimonas sp.]|nr:S9 family peptidase [Paucimonas sp.]